jgi:ferredoxin-NADP reductase/nitrite reductase/ring-hydroxylating ferredoxin subunit
MSDDWMNLWHPVATTGDLPHRHTFHGKLLGRELAVWRADDDFVNVWENRCLHRGVRLSIGINDGRELQCQYHGWRYANRTAGCTYIPAHPADAPAQTICNRTFPAIERYGLVWSGEDPLGEVPGVAVLDDGAAFGLRSISVNASAELTIAHLAEYEFQPVGHFDGAAATMTADARSELSVTLTSHAHEAASTAVFYVQPVDADVSVIRGVLSETPADGDQIVTLRHHSTELARLRERIEADAASRPAPTPMVATIEQVPRSLSAVAETPSGRKADYRVVVARKWETAERVAGFELESIGNPLPTYQPGAHIDVHLPNGLIRQYSLTNGPGEGSVYRIGVKLEPGSRGGSSCLHETVREGDVLAISAPRNNFPLRRDSVKTILVAGGIGVTPLLAMAQTLARDGLDYKLHYFAQTDDHLAFAPVLDRLGDGVVRHLGLSPDDTGSTLTQLLAEYDGAYHVYVCGPGPMLEATRDIAADAGWPDDAVHFEYFKNTTEIDDSSTFEISLARSALTLDVPGGKTILEVLRDNGVPMPSSCEQGACGTCSVNVLEGEPDHQDVHLNKSEKAAGNRIMTCVSRAKSARLVLDI